MLYEKLNCINNFSLLIKAWEDIRNTLCQVNAEKTWLINSKGYILAGNNTLSSFCCLVQKTIEGKRKCAECYYQNCFSTHKITDAWLNSQTKSNQTSEILFFKCHAGLTNFAFPLILQKQLMGAIVGGGILAEQKDGRGAFRKARFLRVSPDSYLAKLKDIPVKSIEDLQLSGQTVLPYVQSFSQNLKDQLNKFKNIHAFAAQTRWNQMMFDDLTGLPNKQYLQYRLRQEITGSKRKCNPTCLLVIRLENLDILNQKLGHPKGDIRLKEFADLLTKTARRMDIVVRYKGNVFALLLPNSSQKQGVEVANRLMPRINVNSVLRELSIKVGLFKCTSAHNRPEILDSSVELALKQASFNGNLLKVLPSPSLSYASKKKRRVVITGVGIVSCLGCDKETFRQNIYEGRSGIRRLTLFNPDEFSSRVAGEVRGFDPLQYLDANKLAMLGRASTFAISAAKQAVDDAGLIITDEDKSRIGVSIGSAVAGLEFGEAQVHNFLKFGAGEISPYLSIIVFGGAVSSETSIALGIRGRSATISTGCAAGTDAIGEAFHQIREGKSDVVITGGTDAPIREVIFGSFCTIESLSTRYNDHPEQASRPFDRERDGFVIAEGAGMVVVEELQHALRRGAHIYGEIVGFGATNDAYHMSRPAPDGLAAATAMRMALKDAHLEPKHIEYINVHGSSTPLNDSTETRIIKEVFGKHSYKLAISSTKSMIGHPIGASGAMELIASLLGMENNFIPPTINYEFPDPDCDLDCVPNQARSFPINIFLSNSLGFGGKNASIIVCRY